jgi:ParB family transcriptional regulator, chromosome partitioning protein
MAKTTGLASISEGSSDLLKIDPRNLHVRESWNARDWGLQENVDHIEQLAQSIAAVGVKQPLTVYWENGKAWIDDGECRYRAVMLCIDRGVPIKTVPCRAADRNGNEADRRFNRYLANTGKQFNQLETARDWKWFLDLGWSQEDIAKRAGLSQGRVSQVLAVLNAPVAVQKMIGNGEVSPSLAMQVVREEGTEAEKTLRAGLEAAKQAGGTKVKGEHVGKANIKTLLVDMLDSSDINEDDEECCVIKIPAEKWELVKAALKY